MRQRVWPVVWRLQKWFNVCQKLDQRFQVESNEYMHFRLYHFWRDVRQCNEFLSIGICFFQFLSIILLWCGYDRYFELKKSQVFFRMISWIVNIYVKKFEILIQIWLKCFMMKSEKTCHQMILFLARMVKKFTREDTSTYYFYKFWLILKKMLRFNS